MSVKSGVFLCVILLSPPLFAADVLIEAEGFDQRGGWAIDQQFMDVMGSSYLLAHGLGKPVEDACTQHTFAEGGTYYVWVRAKDWVTSHHPGRFRVLINGHALPVELGANGKDWSWEPCGSVVIDKGPVTIELNDLTGFDGRCDALFFTTDAQVKPPAEPNEEMQMWRRKLLGLPEEPADAGKFDVVVVGGGIANAGKLWSNPKEDPYLRGYAFLIPTVTKMFEKLHPGKRYYLTNIYARGVKPSEVLAWKDDLWMFPYYTNRNFVPYDAREGGVAALGYQ